MSSIDESEYVGLANWKVTPPLPDPFEATVGDSTRYTVHLLTIERANDAFLRDRLAEFIAAVLRFAERRSRDETRLVAFEFDLVYCRLTVSLFDADFKREDSDQFKLSVVPWDAEVNGEESDEADWEQRANEMWGRLCSLLKELFNDTDIVPTFERLLSRGFTFALFKRGDTPESWLYISNA